MPRKTLTAKVNPEVLKWARESAGYEIEATAKRVGRSKELVRRWESGEEAPTFRILEELAKFYKRPLACFVLV